MKPATRKAMLRCAALFGVLMAASMPAAFGHSTLGDVAALYKLAESSNPYVQPAHGALLYLGAPLVVLSSCIMLLAPGLALAAAIGAARTTGQWIVCGFALSVVVISATAATVQAATGTALQGTSFVAVVLGCTVAAFLVLAARNLACPYAAWPWQHNGASRTVLAMLAAPWLILIALAPKFYWENFNGDGAHAFESARLLLSQATPFWPASAGDISSFPSLNSSLFAFANSWFIRLFGEFEAAARVSLLLYLMVLYAGIVAIVEHAQERTLPRIGHVLIWLQLSVYVVVMAYSATYNPYFSDLALPATQDTQMMVCFLGFVLACLYRSTGWMCLFIVMLSLSLPITGLMLPGMFAAALVATSKPRPWRIAITAAATLAGCVLLGSILPTLMQFGGLPIPGGEYTAENLAERVDPGSSLALILNNIGQIWPHLWSRLMYLLLPCGILPALFLAYWKRQDALARSLTLLTAAYYLPFFVWPGAALHHFVPVMIIPVVIFSRMSLATAREKGIPWRPWQAVAAAMISILICLPAHFRLHTEARLVGSAIEDRIGGYERSNAQVFAGSELLAEIIPLAWDAARLGTYGGSPLMWNYYAHTGKAGADRPNYVLQHYDDPPPNDMKLVIHRDGLALYVKSDDIWQAHRSIAPAVGFADHVFVFPGGRTWVAGKTRGTGAKS